MKKTPYKGLPLFLALAAALFIYLGFARDAGGGLSIRPGTDKASSTPPLTEITGPHVFIGEARIRVEVATTTAAVRKGLSGRPGLEEDEGMLFIFPVADIYRFWMPDMNFPLDIIWIMDGVVVDISRNVSNEFDPAKPVFYSPREKATQVLEVNAGYAERHRIEIGDRVVLRNIF